MRRLILMVFVLCLGCSEKPTTPVQATTPIQPSTSDNVASERQIVSLKSQLADANRKLAAAVEMNRTSEAHWRDWAAAEIKKIKDAVISTAVKEDIAIQLAKMNQLERGRFKRALDNLRTGKQLKPSEAEILDRVPAVRDEFAAAMLKQEQQREFKELVAP